MPHMTEVVLMVLYKANRDLTVDELKKHVGEVAEIQDASPIRSALLTLIDYEKISKIVEGRTVRYRFAQFTSHLKQDEIRRMRAIRKAQGRRDKFQSVIATLQPRPCDLWPVPEGATLGPPLYCVPMPCEAMAA